MTSPGVRAIVVDDELLGREGLSAELQHLGVDVVAICADAHSARDAIVRLRPDLLFLDIAMPEMDGFALLELLEPEDLSPAVIFVTAFDRHAVRAFESRALDYLLKPVSPARLKVAVERGVTRVEEARALRDGATSADEHTSTAGDEYLSRIVVKDRDQVIVIPVADLEWIEAETYYVRLHAARLKPRLLRERMSVLEARLDPKHFFRTHRSAIVRIDLIRSVRSVSRYEHTVILSTGAEAPLSRDKRARLEALLNGS